MKPRRQPYGNKNVSGLAIERIRKERGMKQSELLLKMQVMGLDINQSSLSKVEGKKRIVSDIELRAIAHILGVSIMDLVPPLDETEAE